MEEEEDNLFSFLSSVYLDWNIYTRGREERARLD